VTGLFLLPVPEPRAPGFHGVEFTLDPSRGRNDTNRFFDSNGGLPLRDDYLKEALKLVPDANCLINVVSRRVKQLKRGHRPLVESLEKLSPEDIALREVIEGKISYEAAVEA
jgi:DNA-directed RNA polymerase subunit omega